MKAQRLCNPRGNLPSRKLEKSSPFVVILTMYSMSQSLKAFPVPINFTFLIFFAKNEKDLCENYLVQP